MKKNIVRAGGEKSIKTGGWNEMQIKHELSSKARGLFVASSERKKVKRFLKNASFVCVYGGSAHGGNGKTRND